MAQGELLLDVQNLSTHFNTEEGIVRAVDRVSFQVYKGQTLGIVGESGCGKSVTAKSIMQIVPKPNGRIVEGKILYHREDGVVDIATLHYQSQEMRELRGNEISMIFQEPMTSLNPVYTIGDQIMEAIQLHQKLDKQAAREKTIEMLAKVGIPSPRERIDRYPHEFSGGMRQRVMIAMALSCSPKLLIADEPTTALDVTVEAQIINLMQDLQDEMGMSIIMITHDLGVIAGIADRVLVMYAGWVVEEGSTEEIFYSAKHPYTQALLQSVPRIGRTGRLNSIKGTVPDLINLPQGWCYFAPRCSHVMDICLENEPPMCALVNGRRVKCWLYQEGEASA
ncbi:MAG: ABC transporter ATP-binding protein [Firmicutes bacterium]|nr:ABC transporter ATP-binding protein [Bacillota bacterium]